MFHVSNIFTTVPEQFKTQLQEKTYAALVALDLPFERVDTDEAITMKDCIQIDDKLNMKMVKTLFLCNQQKTAFYLFITLGGKPFRSKDFSIALEVSRVSFAPALLMEQILGTKIGAATVFSALLQSARDVQIVFDRDVLAEEWYGCSDGTTTGYMKLQTEDILYKLLPYSKHTAQIVEV